MGREMTPKGKTRGLHPQRGPQRCAEPGLGFASRNSEVSHESAKTADFRLGPPQAAAQVCPGHNTARPWLRS